MPIDSVQHEAYSEVVAHNHHDLNCTLPPEPAHHLFPELAADPVFTKQRAPEGDQRRVFAGESCHIAVVPDHIDNRLLQALSPTRRLMRGPFVQLVDLPCNGSCANMRGASCFKSEHRLAFGGSALRG